MKLRTELPVFPSDWQLDHSQAILSLGSCFATHIGHRLSEHLFDSLVNPFGTLYHPIPLLDLLDNAATGAVTGDLCLVEKDETWHSLRLHSQVSAPDSETLSEQWNRLLATTRQQLAKGAVLLLTFGTAWGFRHRQHDHIVANCHRQPQSDFTRELSTVEEMQKEFVRVWDRIGREFPGTRAVLTVSPVRHVRTGLVENAVSKASLRLLCHQLAAQCDGISYFPAFELLTDDLRDYRFYEKDLIHPNEVAREYVWEHFAQTFFSEPTLALNQELATIRRALAHRPRNPDSEGHQRFLEQLLRQIAELPAHLDTSHWEQEVRQGLKN